MAAAKGDKYKVPKNAEGHLKDIAGQEVEIDEVGTPALALKLPDGMIHKWAIESELELVEKKKGRMLPGVREIIVEGVAQHNPNNYGGRCSREAVISKPAKERKLDEGVDVIAATDAPVLVMDWERWQVIREILPMRYLDLTNGDKVPLLDTHTRNSVEKVKGSATNWRKEDKQTLATIFISKAEEAIRTKIEEGHIDSVSIGYMTDSSYTVEVPKGADVTIDGVRYRNDFTDGIPLLVRTWWQRNELSLVPIGADADAKFRSAGNEKLLEEINTLKAQLSNLAPQVRQITPPAATQTNLTWHEAQLKLANNS